MAAARRRSTNASTGMRATLAADRACGYLVVYAPPERDFVALEPVTHETDAFNRSAAGATRNAVAARCRRARLFLYDARCRVGARLTAPP